jgi:hypothetical protein
VWSTSNFREHQNKEKNVNTEIADKSFEDVAEFRYLERALRNQNYINKIGTYCYVME